MPFGGLSPETEGANMSRERHRAAVMVVVAYHRWTLSPSDAWIRDTGNDANWRDILAVGSRLVAGYGDGEKADQVLPRDVTIREGMLV